MGAIGSVTPIKKVSVKANSEPWFDIEIISAIQKRGKLLSVYKESNFKQDKLQKDNFKTSKMFLQKTLQSKKQLLCRGKTNSKLQKA